MNILVTGATGYIGSHLALKLADEGTTVHLLCRSDPEARLSSHPNIRIFRGDISAPADIANAMLGCEQVFHLAAYARVWAKNPDTFYQVNVTGTDNVLKCALRRGIAKLVFTSTAGVFGPSNGAPCDEHSMQPKSFFNPYALSKAEAERTVLDAAAKGLEAVVVNPTRVYGPGPSGKSNAVTHLIASYMKRKWHLIPGDGTLVANYSFIEDVVRGHIAAMNSGRSGERYILGGINASYNDLFDIIKKQTGITRPLFPFPFPLIKAVATLDLVSSSLFDREPSLTPAWVKGMQFDTARSSEKAIHELGYSITPLEDGIQQTIKWLNARRNEHENHKS